MSKCKYKHVNLIYTVKAIPHYATDANPGLRALYFEPFAITLELTLGYNTGLNLKPTISSQSSCRNRQKKSHRIKNPCRFTDLSRCTQIQYYYLMQISATIKMIKVVGGLKGIHSDENKCPKVIMISKFT